MANIRRYTALAAVLALFSSLFAGRALAADFNGDGKPDLVWSNTANGSTYLWYMNGPAFAVDALITQIDPAWKIQGTADFNGDGHPDLVWRNTITGVTQLWYMNFSARVSDVPLFTLPAEWAIQAVADFNGDGKPDFLVRNTTTGLAFVWFFNNATPIGDQFLFSIEPKWKIEAATDLNGDGKPDLLFRNTSTGLAFVWNTQYAGGTLSLAGASAPIFIIEPVWEIVQVEDWNGDHHPDLVFRNRDSGVVFVWYMNGTALLGSTFITQIDTAWEIAPRPGGGACEPTTVAQSFSGNGIRNIAIDRGTKVALRLPVDTVPGRLTELLSIQSTSSQLDMTVEFALSTCPGKMDVPAECKTWGTVNQSGVTLYAFSTPTLGYCTRELGKQYYITVRDTKFDRATPSCSAQTCYMIVQLNSYAF